MENIKHIENKGQFINKTQTNKLINIIEKTIIAEKNNMYIVNGKEKNFSFFNSENGYAIKERNEIIKLKINEEMCLNCISCIETVKRIK